MNNEETTTPETTEAHESVSAAPSTEMETKKQQILQLTSTKHVKIWLLHEICLMSDKEIAEIMHPTTKNVGHVWNVLKNYNDNPEKIQAAKELLK